MPPLDTETLLQLVEATSPPNAKTEATDDVPDALIVALTGHDDPGGEQGGHSRLQRLWVQTVWGSPRAIGLGARPVSSSPFSTLDGALLEPGTLG